MITHTHLGRTVVWNTVATVTDGVSDVSLVIRYPDGELIPVAVPAGLTALQFSASFTDPAFAAFTVTAARYTRDGVTYESRP